LVFPLFPAYLKKKRGQQTLAPFLCAPPAQDYSVKQKSTRLLRSLVLQIFFYLWYLLSPVSIATQRLLNLACRIAKVNEIL
jgi:hypothetical protein